MNNRVTHTDPEIVMRFLNLCRLSDEPDIASKAYSAITKFRVLESGRLSPQNKETVEKEYIDTFNFLTDWLYGPASS